MSNKTLYIIGNGFDIFHGLKSHYWDFKDFVKNRNPKLFKQLEMYFDYDSLWSDFEETLAYIDTQQIVDECLNYLESYSTENWSEAFNHDYQYELKNRIDLITVELKNLFTLWALSLKEAITVLDKKIELKNDSIFINFNYTDTLEKIYRIHEQNIFYIHNKVVDAKSTLILGHSRDPKKNQDLDKLASDQDVDVRVAEGNQILNAYFIDTYKSTQTIINQHHAYFEKLAGLNEIYILGHSLSLVDFKYFQEIVKIIDIRTTKWKVSVYNRKELAHHSDVMVSLGINLNLVEFGTMQYLYTAQQKLFPKL